MMKRLLALVLMMISVGLFANVGAGFAPDKVNGCPPFVVNFTDTSAGGVTSWKWDFGNGNTSALQHPSATFIKPGSYKIKLIVSDGVLTDSTTQTITVYNTPQANFTADKPSACFYDTIRFTSTTIPGDAPLTDFGWGFGNGLAMNGTGTITYKYDALGAYSITLVVQDSNKCASSKTITDYIHVWPVPVSAFTPTPSSSCVPNTLVKFTNQSSGVGLKYMWDLNGSGIVTAENPTHVYNNEKYVTNLTVVDTNGCQATSSRLVSMSGPSADFRASKVLVCAGEKVQFTNISNFTGTSWAWDFGDGTTSTVASPAKTYTAAGIYSVSFQISDGVCADSTNKPNYMNVRQGVLLPEVSIEYDTTTACKPPLTVHFKNTTVADIVGFQWNFGDGQVSNLENPVTTYTKPGDFTVSLTIMDSSGCIKVGTFPSLISTAGPDANFNVLGSCPGINLQFKGVKGVAQKAVWSFGDGDSSTIISPYHKYANPGTYNVSFTITDDMGCTNTKVKEIIIDTVKLGFEVNSTYSPCPPFVALFRNQSLTPDLKYNWDFGDGITDTTTNPTHIYFYPGVYTVKLMGAAKFGCADTIVATNLITVQGPTATFEVTPSTGCLPLQVNFSTKPSSNTKSIWSDLGDGTVIEDTVQYSHIYLQERVFHPQFVLTDYVGCSVSFPLDSIVTHAIPEISVADTSVCRGTLLNMELESNADSYEWLPKAFINCDTCKAVKINSPDTITYQVTGISKYGCRTDTQMVTINVEPLPDLKDAKAINICKNDTVQLFVGDKAERIEWSPVSFISNDSSFRPVSFPQQSILYTATGYNKLGCTTKASVYLNVQEKLDITLPENINACEFDTVHLWAGVNFASDLGMQYMWTPYQYLDNAKSATPVANMTTRSIDFQVIVNSGHCIPDTATVTVTVNPTPEMEVSADVKSTTMAEIPLYASSREDLNYRWFAKDRLSCDDCKNTFLYPTRSQLVYVEGRNEYGCVVRDSVDIQVQDCNPDAIFMPNTFTPNGDGTNDKFYIRTNAISSLSYFRVFDQWGSLVFETKRLDEGWDGASGGKPGGTAVFVYVLEGKCANGAEVIKSGNITAIQ